MKNILYIILDTIIGLFILTLYIGLGITAICVIIKIIELFDVYNVFTIGMGIVSAIGSVIILIWLFNDIGYEFRISLTEKLKYRRGKKSD